MDRYVLRPTNGQVQHDVYINRTSFEQFRIDVDRFIEGNNNAPALAVSLAFGPTRNRTINCYTFNYDNTKMAIVNPDRVCPLLNDRSNYESEEARTWWSLVSGFGWGFDCVAVVDLRLEGVGVPGSIILHRVGRDIRYTLMAGMNAVITRHPDYEDEDNVEDVLLTNDSEGVFDERTLLVLRDAENTDLAEIFIQYPPGWFDDDDDEGNADEGNAEGNADVGDDEENNVDVGGDDESSAASSRSLLRFNSQGELVAVDSSDDEVMEDAPAAAAGNVAQPNHQGGVPQAPAAAAGNVAQPNHQGGVPQAPAAAAGGVSGQNNIPPLQVEYPLAPANEAVDSLNRPLSQVSVSGNTNALDLFRENVKVPQNEKLELMGQALKSTQDYINEIVGQFRGEGSSTGLTQENAPQVTEQLAIAMSQLENTNNIIAQLEKERRSSSLLIDELKKENAEGVQELEDKVKSLKSTLSEARVDADTAREQVMVILGDLPSDWWGATNPEKMKHITYVRNELSSSTPPFMIPMTDAIFAVERDERPVNMIPINFTITSSRYLNMTGIGWLSPDGTGISDSSGYIKKHADPIYWFLLRIINQMKRAIDEVLFAGGTFEGGTTVDDLWEQTDWTWDIIRAFLHEVKQYLASTGRTFDDLMNAPGDSPDKINFCHISDIDREKTWKPGAVPTIEEGETYVRKMAHPTVFFVGSKSMNSTMGTSKVYDLKYGPVTRGSITVPMWTVSEEQHTSTSNIRSAMAQFEIINLVSPDRQDVDVLRQTSFLEEPSEEGDSSDEDEDQTVDTGNLSISLFGTLNVSYKGSATLVDMGAGSTPRLSIVLSGNTIGYVNLHDQDSICAFLSGVGQNIEGVSTDIDEDGNERIKWEGGCIVQPETSSAPKMRLLNFNSIMVKAQYSHQVRTELENIARRRDVKRWTFGMNEELVNDELQLISELHNFIASVEDGTFDPSDYPNWSAVSPQDIDVVRQQCWIERFNLLLLFFEKFPSLKGRSDCFGVVFKYLNSNGPGRDEALDAFLVAFPDELRIWWKDQRSTTRTGVGFLMLTLNPNNQYYAERIQLLQDNDLWDESVVIDDSIPAQPIGEVHRRTGIVILKSTTTDIHNPQVDDYVAVFGSLNITKAVMALGGNTFSAVVSNIEKNDRGPPYFTNQLNESTKAVVGNTRKWVIKSEVDFVYYARTVTEDDLDEGIYCNPLLLPAPHRFLLADDHGNKQLSSEEWQNKSDEKYQGYVAAGKIRAFSFTGQNARVPTILLNGSPHDRHRVDPSDGRSVLWQTANDGREGFIRLGMRR